MLLPLFCSPIISRGHVPAPVQQWPLRAPVVTRPMQIGTYSLIVFTCSVVILQNVF